MRNTRPRVRRQCGSSPWSAPRQSKRRQAVAQTADFSACDSQRCNRPSSPSKAVPSARRLTHQGQRSSEGSTSCLRYSEPDPRHVVTPDPTFTKKSTRLGMLLLPTSDAGADKRYPPHNEWAPPHTHGWLVVVIMVIYSALVRWRGQGVVFWCRPVVGYSLYYSRVMEWSYLLLA